MTAKNNQLFLAMNRTVINFCKLVGVEVNCCTQLVGFVLNRSKLYGVGINCWNKLLQTKNYNA